MRVMVLVLADEERDPSEYGEHVDEFEAMGKYNEELVKAGVMLAGEGLAPTAQGKRLTFAGDGDGGLIVGDAGQLREQGGGHLPALDDEVARVLVGDVDARAASAAAAPAGDDPWVHDAVLPIHG